MLNGKFSQSTFIISLDLELIWGVVHTDSDPSLLMMDKRKGRGTIDLLLNVFEKYNIPATWAVVGHLFLDKCEKDEGIPHKDIPRFKEDWYSCDPCTDIHKDPLYYGRDIIEKILSSPIRHEIGYHSFSHVIFSECRREVAKAEIKEGIKLAKEFGITLKSFVFPQDKIGHHDVLKENGFRIYRGRIFKRGNINQRVPIRKINGAIDMIIAKPVEPRLVDGIWEIPSSMLFSASFPFIYSLLPRAKIGIYRAMRSNKVFHVWLHPQNLLYQPSLEKKLDKLLAFVAKKRDEGKIEVMTMGEFAEVLDSRQSCEDCIRGFGI